MTKQSFSSRRGEPFTLKRSEKRIAFHKPLVNIRGALMWRFGHICTVIGHSCPIDKHLRTTSHPMCDVIHFSTSDACQCPKSSPSECVIKLSPKKDSYVRRFSHTQCCLFMFQIMSETHISTCTDCRPLLLSKTPTAGP